MFSHESGLPLNIYSVSDLTAYIRAVLESNENLIDIWVSGEISNLSQPKSGHIYFTLKDANASLRCVIWREQAWRLKGALRDGMSVEAHGSISVYEQGGQYQLYVDGLRAAGEGLLYQEFLRLKAELEAEGLFDEERKRSLPRYPRLIGIVTSPTGAALQDMLNTLRGRYPLAEVVLAPATVQGDDAPPQIVHAIEALNRVVKPDVILVARGGGSLEDLWAFNDERVVRAVAASRVPVISGVGHETDFTLTDFAADLRAPTPTGAAVLAVPNISDLAAELNGWTLRLQQNVLEALSRSSMVLNEKAHRLERQSPLWQVRQDRQYLDGLSQRLQLHINHDLKNRRSTLVYFGERLTGLDPAHILRRGYALVKDSTGSLITSAKQVKLGEDIAVQLADGSLDAQVQQVHSKEG
ncbi:exodeoxyribonuclease VII large subunit [Pelolinea submarina]|uniref:Exodeoxyribonuclease 7 large subunit n=1 Tax=Pelolinea submarina TaxID=913107 RepID=A0A347ZNM2_9CHLR|nr:exodeoxyribonuclease VII large subunit [Pelolinea submarina]REG08506.1 exodeoxyribonuclease VII large subunit [Pelolinea submarina]BBB46903.1 exodeoxyribonuclease VII large subunit [Pelolinea submarina]